MWVAGDRWWVLGCAFNAVHHNTSFNFFASISFFDASDMKQHTQFTFMAFRIWWYNNFPFSFFALIIFVSFFNFSWAFSSIFPFFISIECEMIYLNIVGCSVIFFFTLPPNIKYIHTTRLFEYNIEFKIEHAFIQLKKRLQDGSF